MTIEADIRLIADETHDFNPPRESADVSCLLDPDCRSLFIELGPKGDKGSDHFYSDFLIDEDMADDEPYRFHYGRVIGRSFSMTKYRSAIETIVQSIKAQTWEEFAMQMTPYMHWQFDGYTKYNPK
jgi:hypothetical protein